MGVPVGVPVATEDQTKRGKTVQKLWYKVALWLITAPAPSRVV
jgi:hypothetical protein